MAGRKMLGFLLVLLMTISGCALPSLHAVAQPAGLAALPDTSAQQALVRQYVADLAAGRHADAWHLLTPQRQGRESVDQCAAQWRQREVILPKSGNLVIWPAAIDEIRVWATVKGSRGAGREVIAFTLSKVDGQWRVADEKKTSPPPNTAPGTLPTSPAAFARQSVAAEYGSLYLATFRMLSM